MGSRSAPRDLGRDAEVVVHAPDRAELGRFELDAERITVGRLPDRNDIALQPDPELLVTRVAHCTLEREGKQWFVVDGGSVNGTFLRRDGRLERVDGRVALRDGDVV